MSEDLEAREVIRLRPIDPSRVQSEEFGITVTIPKRPNKSIIFRPGEEEKFTLRLRDLPPVPEEEKGRTYSQEDVGWIFERTSPNVFLTSRERHELWKLLIANRDEINMSPEQVTDLSFRLLDDDCLKHDNPGYEPPSTTEVKKRMFKYKGFSTRGLKE